MHLNRTTRSRASRAGRSRRLGAVAAIAVTGAALVAGCGGASSNGEANKPAATVYKDAQNATKTLTSVKIAGSMTSNDKPLKLDVVAGTNAGGGTVTADGATFQLVLSGKTIYIKSNAAGWASLTQSQTEAKTLADKWLSAPTSDQNLGQFDQFVSISSLTSGLTPSGNFSKQPQTTFNGHKAIPLKDNGQNQGVLYVAATGKPYILGLKGGSESSGAITFTNFDSAKAPKAPSGAQDFSKIAGTGG